MMNSFSKLLIFVLPVLVAGCATAPPRSERCDSFCQEIASCLNRSGQKSQQELLCKIARCETGNKCTAAIDSHNRHYRGPFQFSRQTWHTQCGPIFKQKKLKSCRSDAAMHDLCCSSACAAEMVAQGGRANWPVCGR